MLIILSPAKTLDFSRRIHSNIHSEPIFVDEANVLAQKMKGYAHADLMQVMKMSDKLAELTYQRFQDWDSGDVEMKQAGAAFKGEAYNGLDLPTLSDLDVEFVQDHLRILSGMYGVLRPCDLIKPYRLEMGSKLNDGTLYRYWGDKVTEALNGAMEKAGRLLVNLASNEYFKSINAKLLDAEVITPEFKELKDGKLKTIVVYTKKARGMMARYIIENELTSKEDLKSFAEAGYTFNADLSTESTYLFTR